MARETIDEHARPHSAESSNAIELHTGSSLVEAGREKSLLTRLDSPLCNYPCMWQGKRSETSVKII